MSSLTIYKDNYSDSTAISNLFIDEYMVDANDAQIKVYLYLIRMMSANRETDISDMADKFNHTEKDILRSLKYWEKKQLLSLEYDNQGKLTGIRLTDPHDCVHPTVRPTASIVPIKQPEPAAPASVLQVQSQPQVREITQRSYSRDELKAFKESPETGQLLFIAEAYLGKQLTMSDIETLYFFNSELGFSCELVDFLLQYCIDKGKKSFSYIKTVAIDWAEHNIATSRQAKSYIRNSYDKSVYTVLKLLGRMGSPTAKEAQIVGKWTGDYAFSMEIIEEACNRTVVATDSHRLEYCDKVLSSWFSEGVHELKDVAERDSAYRRSRSAKPVRSNSFTQIPQNDYDFDALERKLLGN
ncbi:MAG: DnaD domain protein [Lachnospiraceae bacterium]|nr:DnaD domain protein [Lachnospiraceae bacterium]